MPPSDNEAALLAAFVGKGRLLGDMLQGALHTFHDAGNPERIAQTAHSIREVMQKLVLWGDTIIRAPGPKLGDRVRELGEVVDRARDESSSHVSARWDGPIDGLVRRMLVETEKLVGRLADVKLERIGGWSFWNGTLDGYPVVVSRTMKGIAS